jgi:hypothetical protein
MKTLRPLGLAAATALLAISAADADYAQDQKEQYERIQKAIIDGTQVNGAHFAAIANSRTTGRWGSANGWEYRADAENVARKMCHAADADVVVYVKDGYVALAVGDNGIYGAGYGTTRKQAEEMALRECGKRTSNAKMATSVCSASVPKVAPRPGRIIRK